MELDGVTDYPCLIDTDTVMQTLDAGGYKADLLLGADADNGLFVDDAGLRATYGVTPAGRSARTDATQTVTPGAFTPNFLTTRFDTTGFVIANGASGQVQTYLPGLWWPGGWWAGASAGNVGSLNVNIQDIVAATGLNVALDQSSSASAADFIGSDGMNTNLAINTSGFVWVTQQNSGAGFLPVISSAFLVNVTLQQSSVTPGNFPFVASAEMASCELWGCLVRPF
jgi:hypothetical protein